MRLSVLFAASVGVFLSLFAGLAAAQKDDKKDATPTPAAAQTLTKSLKAKVSLAATEARLGDVLKEFAAQVDMKADLQVMWTYGPNFPFAQKVTYSCKDKPLEDALDELSKKVGPLGYVVVSKDGDRHDGWIRVTTTGERGAEVVLPKATAEEESDAADKLALAKKLLDKGDNDKAKIVLSYIVKKYPTAKAFAEAKELLGTLEK